VYFAKISKEIVKEYSEKMKKDGVTILRFVDDILVIGNKEADLSWVKREFCKKSRTLNFTEENPVKGKIRFLDLIIVGEEGMCWEYQPREEKPRLISRSSHSRMKKKWDYSRSFTECSEKVVQPQDETSSKASNGKNKGSRIFSESQG
jgi:hypothetical protein